MRSDALIAGLIATLLSGGCLSGGGRSGGADAADSAAAPDNGDDIGTATCSPACDNGGSCVDGACVCPKGYAGLHCGVFEGPCAPGICHKGGTCVTTADGYRCECASGGARTDCRTHALEVTLSAPGLARIRDVVWDVELVDGKGEPVWQRRVTASAHGVGDGSASVAGVCGENPDGSVSELRVWFVGAYERSVSLANAGDFNATHDGVVGDALPIVRPTSAATPIRRQLVCTEGPKAKVTFDVTLMLPAVQGFFDDAVAFDAFFCSAALTCCDDANSDGACAPDGAEDRPVLFDASGERGSSFVISFACATDVSDLDDAVLYLDDLTLDCTSPGADAFAPDITLSPSAGGMLCTAGVDGMSSCPYVREAPGVDADDYLFQLAVYEGIETIGPNNRIYWNLALGVKRPAITGCRLRLRGTAVDSGARPQHADGVLFPAAVYPYLAWDAPLGSCTYEMLTFNDPDATVRALYSAPPSSASFANGYGPSRPIAPFDRGPTCETEDCE